jgi:hypothetical protein
MYHISQDPDLKYLGGPPPDRVYVCICITSGTVYANADPDAGQALEGLVASISEGEGRHAPRVFSTVSRWLLRPSWGAGRCALFMVHPEDPFDSAIIESFVRDICDKDRSTPPSMVSLRVLGQIQPQ